MEVGQLSLLRSFQRMADILLYIVHSKGCGQKTLQGKWRTAIFLRSLPPTRPLTKGTAHVLFATSKSSRSSQSEDSYGSCILCRWKLRVSYKLKKNTGSFRSLSHGKALQMVNLRNKYFLLKKDTVAQQKIPLKPA